MIVRIEIEGEYVRFINIDGKTYTYKQNEVKRIRCWESGYGIILNKKKFYVNKNYQYVTVVNNGSSHEGI